MCECYTSNLVRWGSCGVSSVQCPLCSEVTVTRYLSPLEQQMVTQVVIGLSNVTFLSIQAVASNELGRREANMEAISYDKIEKL